MLRTFPKRLLSAIISAPLSGMIMQFLQYMNTKETEIIFTDYAFFYFLLASYLFIFPAFLLIGIPLSYLVDYISCKISFNNWIVNYCFKFLLYVLITSFVFLIFFDVFIFSDFDLLNTSLVPALIGFHVLFLLRKEYQFKDTSTLLN